MNSQTKRLSFTFSQNDPLVQDLKELQYNFSSLNLQEILKVAVSKLKSAERKEMDSADIETAYILSRPEWVDDINAAIDENEYYSEEEMWEALKKQD